MLVAAALLALAPAAAAAAPWVEGVHYERVPAPQDRAAGAPIQVIEAFWYACPTCYNLEPHLERWLAAKPDDVEFIRIHASLAPTWRTSARAFYAAEALGVTDRVHGPLFRAVHVERRDLGDFDTLAAVFEAHGGVDREAFRESYNSFGVERRMRNDDRLVRGYRVQGVPSLIINGKYRTTPGHAKGYRQLIELVDYLVDQERKQ